MEKREWYGLETSGLARADAVSDCRSALTVVASEVGAYECDIPWSRSQEAEWPVDVIAAAQRLSIHRQGKRGENDGYRTTGVMLRADEGSDQDWLDFVTFAPYAYGSSTWNESFHWLTDLNDEGTSLAARLTQSEASVLAAQIGGERVILLKSWRTRLNESLAFHTGIARR